MTGSFRRSPVFSYIEVFQQQYIRKQFNNSGEFSSFECKNFSDLGSHNDQFCKFQKYLQNDMRLYLQ